MATYRVGVIGDTKRGRYGHGLDSVWLAMPNCHIVGVADPDPAGLAAKVKQLKAPRGFADYRQLLESAELDIVAICPRWLDQHRDIALAAAERGIHIYMEKPMCRTLAEADEIVAACEKNNVKLALAYQTRYSPKIQVIRDLIQDGQIGQVLELRGRGKEDRRGGGEDLWVLGSHIMNLMYTFGGEAEWCFASVTTNGHPITADDVKPGAEGIGPLAGDTISAMYGMQEEITGYFATSRDSKGGRFGLQILGSKGVIDLTTGYLPRAYLLLDPAWSPGRSGKSWLPITSAGVGKPEPIREDTHTAGNVAACSDLIAAIEEDRQPETSVYEARTSTEMIVSVFESQRQGKPVSLPLKNRQNPLSQLKWKSGNGKAES